MFNWLLELDQKVFLCLNSIHSPVWDSIMYWISGDKSWIPLYIMLLIIVIYRERPYHFIYTILFIAIAVVLSDKISVLIKILVERPRPTHNADIADIVHIVNDYRGGTYGFVSSHAANVFCATTFLAYQFKNYKWSLFLIVWATVVSYSRIYIGVHYPLDIIFGAVLGTLLGTQCYVFKVRTAIAIDRRMEICKEKKEEKEKQKSKE